MGRLLRTKEECCSNINEKIVTDYKPFCKTVAQFPSGKTLKFGKIRLVGNNGIITEENQIAEVFLTFFKNIVT